jgi:hypothetical protein
LQIAVAGQTVLGNSPETNFSWNFGKVTFSGNLVKRHSQNAQIAHLREHVFGQSRQIVVIERSANRKVLDSFLKFRVENVKDGLDCA